MSQSCFSLRFLSQNSLWKLSTFCGYKGLNSSVYEECEESCFNQTGHSGDSTSRLERVASLSRELESGANCLAKLEVLSCNAPTIVTLQVPCMLHTCATFGNLPVMRSSRKAFLECTHLEFSSHSITHYPYINPT